MTIFICTATCGLWLLYKILGLKIIVAMADFVEPGYKGQ